MRLHQYPELFHETLRAAAEHLHIKLEFVEEEVAEVFTNLLKRIL